jgi:hypothetical protein
MISRSRMFLPILLFMGMPGGFGIADDPDYGGQVVRIW